MEPSDLSVILFGLYENRLDCWDWTTFKHNDFLEYELIITFVNFAIRCIWFILLIDKQCKQISIYESIFL